jgi:hypothetical protein
LDDNGAVALAAELINGGQTIAAAKPFFAQKRFRTAWMLLCKFTEISALAAQALCTYLNRYALEVAIKHSVSAMAISAL